MASGLPGIPEPSPFIKLSAGEFGFPPASLTLILSGVLSMSAGFSKVFGSVSSASDISAKSVQALSGST